MTKRILWLNFILIILFAIIKIKGQVQENQVQDQGQTPEQNTGQIQEQNTVGQTQNQKTSQSQEQNTSQNQKQNISEQNVGQTQQTTDQNQVQQTINQNQVQNQESISNLGSDVGIEPSYKFCKHYDGAKILLSRNSIKQYKINDKKIVKEYTIEDENVIDYHIAFILETEGLCYYNDDRNEIPISKIYDSLEIAKITEDQYRPLSYNGHIKYAVTINCYIYYRDNLYIQSPDPMTDENFQKFSKLKRPCLNQCIEYLESINSFIENGNLCTYPSLNMRTIYDNNPEITDEASLQLEIGLQRKRYYDRILEFCNELNSNQDFDCANESNMEVVNCGFDDLYIDKKQNDNDEIKTITTSELRNQYCDTTNVLDLSGLDDSKSCCKYKYIGKEEILIDYVVRDQSFYSGISIASVFGIIGLYYSIKYIKEIKTQESIQKSIINQGREYQQSNKIMIENAKKKGFDPNEQIFNSTSRNLNTATLRNTRINPNNTMTSFSSSLHGGNTTVRYPTNSFAVSQDYTSSDKRDISLRRGMIVQLIQKYEGGWVMVKDINSNRQGYAPEYCIGNKLN